MTDSNLTTPIDRLVWDTVARAEVPPTLADLCSSLSRTTRYASYSLERSVLEQVEMGDLVMVGNMVMIPDSEEEGAFPYRTDDYHH